jgi:hypothetical protein
MPDNPFIQHVKKEAIIKKNGRVSPPVLQEFTY